MNHQKENLKSTPWLELYSGSGPFQILETFELLNEKIDKPAEVMRDILLLHERISGVSSFDFSCKLSYETYHIGLEKVLVSELAWFIREYGIPVTKDNSIVKIFPQLFPKKVTECKGSSIRKSFGRPSLSDALSHREEALKSSFGVNGCVSVYSAIYFLADYDESFTTDILKNKWFVNKCHMAYSARGVGSAYGVVNGAVDYWKTAYLMTALFSKRYGEKKVQNAVNGCFV